jgi:hypothetical protein
VCSEFVGTNSQFNSFSEFEYTQTLHTPGLNVLAGARICGPLWGIGANTSRIIFTGSGWLGWSVYLFILVAVQNPNPSLQLGTVIWAIIFLYSTGAHSSVISSTSPNSLRNYLSAFCGNHLSICLCGTVDLPEFSHALLSDRSLQRHNFFWVIVVRNL